MKQQSIILYLRLEKRKSKRQRLSLQIPLEQVLSAVRRRQAGSPGQSLQASLCCVPGAGCLHFVSLSAFVSFLSLSESAFL